MSNTECYTGQPYVGYEKVACSKCGIPVGIRTNGYFDKYNDPFHKGGSYVHYDCLSSQRKLEIDEEAKKELERTCILCDQGIEHSNCTFD